MKLTIKREIFHEALQKVTSIIGARSTLPVLANVLLEAEEQKLVLTTTDLEIRIRTECEAKIESPGVTTINGKKLLSVVHELSGEEVNLESDESHHTQLQCGAASFRLNGLAPDDFPLPVELEPVRQMKFQQIEIGRILSQISYASSTDDSRKILNGILFSVRENAFTAVATDGKRLALVEKVLDDYTGEEGDAVLPSKSASELHRLMDKKGDIHMELGKSQALFRFGPTTMTSKLIEGTYPNYRQVIPTSFSKKIEIPTEVLSAALRRVSLVVSETSSYVKLTFTDGNLELSASSTEFGDSQEKLPIEYSGQEIAISFNPIYLSAPFRSLDADKIYFQLNDNFSPIAMSAGEGFLYVIMPMRNK